MVYVNDLNPIRRILQPDYPSVITCLFLYSPLILVVWHFGVKIIAIRTKYELSAIFSIRIPCTDNHLHDIIILYVVYINVGDVVFLVIITATAT